MIHGSRTTYIKKGCRCEPCTTANREYQRQFRSAGPRSATRHQDYATSLNCELCGTPVPEHTTTMLFGACATT